MTFLNDFYLNFSTIRYTHISVCTSLESSSISRYAKIVLRIRYSFAGAQQNGGRVAARPNEGIFDYFFAHKMPFE